jgi:hypothetical protein
MCGVQGAAPNAMTSAAEPRAVTSNTGLDSGKEPGKGEGKDKDKGKDTDKWPTRTLNRAALHKPAQMASPGPSAMVRPIKIVADRAISATGAMLITIAAAIRAKVGLTPVRPAKNLAAGNLKVNALRVKGLKAKAETVETGAGGRLHQPNARQAATGSPIPILRLPSFWR